MPQDMRVALGLALFGLCNTVLTAIVEGFTVEVLGVDKNRTHTVSGAVGLTLGAGPLVGGVCYLVYRGLWLFTFGEPR